MKIKLLFITFLITTFFSLSIFRAASDQVNTEPDDFETSQVEDEVYDPLEPINRAIFSFNNVADKLVLEPVAKGYKKLPSPLQSGISNFLSNLRTPLVVLNQLLQGQGENAIQSTGRFLINSTVGVFGIIDVADKIGIEEKRGRFWTNISNLGSWRWFLYCFTVIWTIKLKRYNRYGYDNDDRSHKCVCS